MAKLKGGSYVAGSLTVEGMILAESFSTPAGTSMVIASTATPPTTGKLLKAGATAFTIVDSLLSESGSTVSAAGDFTAASVYIKEDANLSSFALRLYCDSGLTADKTLTLNVGDGNRTLSLGANLSVASYAVTLAGNSAGTSALTLPAGTTVLNALTAGYALYASADNTISGEAALSSTRGGTGLTNLALFTLIYGSGAAAVSTLAPNTSTTPQVLMMTGTGTAGAAPVWSTIPNTALQHNSITINGTTVELGGSATIAGGSSINYYPKRTDTATYPVVWADGSNPVANLYSCASVYIQSSIGRLTATSFNAASSYKLKTDIKAFSGSALDIIMSTEICTYYYKSDVEKLYLKAGFIAEFTHELLATGFHDTMDLSSSIGVLIKAVQELNDKVDKLAKQRRPLFGRW